MFAVNKFKMKESSVEEFKAENMSTTSSQKARIQKIEQLIEENESFSSFDDESDEDSISEKNIEVTPEVDAQNNAELHFLKHYIMNKLISKPLGQLNC